MVLAELGKGLTNALAKLQTNAIIDDEMVNEVIKDICNALLRVSPSASVLTLVRCEAANRHEAPRTNKKSNLC